MKIGYFCNTTNWKKKSYTEILDNARDIAVYCDKNTLQIHTQQIRPSTCGADTFLLLVRKSRIKQQPTNQSLRITKIIQ